MGRTYQEPRLTDCCCRYLYTFALSWSKGADSCGPSGGGLYGCHEQGSFPSESSSSESDADTGVGTGRAFALSPAREGSPSPTIEFPPGEIKSARTEPPAKVLLSTGRSPRSGRGLKSPCVKLRVCSRVVKFLVVNCIVDKQSTACVELDRTCQEKCNNTTRGCAKSAP